MATGFHKVLDMADDVCDVMDPTGGLISDIIAVATGGEAESLLGRTVEKVADVLTGDTDIIEEGLLTAEEAFFGSMDSYSGYMDVSYPEPLASTPEYSNHQSTTTDFQNTKIQNQVSDYDKDIDFSDKSDEAIAARANKLVSMYLGGESQ